MNKIIPPDHEKAKRNFSLLVSPISILLFLCTMFQQTDVKAQLVIDQFVTMKDSCNDTTMYVFIQGHANPFDTLVVLYIDYGDGRMDTTFRNTTQDTFYYGENINYSPGTYTWTIIIQGVLTSESDTATTTVYRSALCGGALSTEKQFMTPHAATIYPNPFSSELNVVLQSAGNYQYRIYNISGQEVVSGRALLSAGELLKPDVTALLPGFYILQIQSGDEMIIRKISKQ